MYVPTRRKQYTFDLWTDLGFEKPGLWFLPYHFLMSIGP